MFLATFWFGPWDSLGGEQAGVFGNFRWCFRVFAGVKSGNLRNDWEVQRESWELLYVRHVVVWFYLFACLGSY